MKDAACPTTLLSSYKRKIIPFLIPCLHCCQMGGFQEWVSIHCAFPEGGSTWGGGAHADSESVSSPVLLSSVTLTTPPPHSLSSGCQGLSFTSFSLLWKSILFLCKVLLLSLLINISQSLSCQIFKKINILPPLNPREINWLWKSANADSDKIKYGYLCWFNSRTTWNPNMLLGGGWAVMCLFPLFCSW